MELTLQYFDGCPNWRTMDTRLRKLISGGELDATISYQLIDTPEAAIVHGFPGSPTLLIDGADPFADQDAPPAYACRIYQTEQGPAGSPTSRQLERAIASARERM